MKTHFTSDPHIAHENILAITFRKFSSIEEHNGLMIENINRQVAKYDRLYILGDVVWGFEQSWMAQIRCKNKHLIYGNHDKSILGKYFVSCAETAEIKLELPERWRKDEDKSVRVYLNHYANAYWPGSHRGSLHLYGHTHAQREVTLSTAFPGRRSMDVGVDAAKITLGEYRPFTDDEVLDLLMPQPGHDNLSYYRRLQDDPKHAKFVYDQWPWKRKAINPVAADEFYNSHLGQPWDPNNG